MALPVPAPPEWADAPRPRATARRALLVAGAVVGVVGLSVAGYGAARGTGVVVVLALVPAGLGVALAARGARERPRERAAPRIESIVADGTTTWGLRFDHDHRYGWQALAWGGVLMASLAAPILWLVFLPELRDGLGRTIAGAFLAQGALYVSCFFGLFAIVGISWYRSLWRRPPTTLHLHADGLDVHRAVDRVGLGWSDIADVHAELGHSFGLLRRARRARRRQVAVALTTTAPDLEDARSRRMGLFVRSRIYEEPPALVLTVEDLRQHPATFLAALTHYHRCPEERELLPDHHWSAGPS